MTTSGLVLLLLLSGKPAKAPKSPPKPASPVATVRAAVEKASPACREALAGPLGTLEKAVVGAASPAGRERALEVLTDVFSVADGADCSPALRQELATLRLRLASQKEAAPAPEETDTRDLALRTLELAQRSMETPECEAAIGKHVERWLGEFHKKKANRAMALEMRAKAKAVAKVCDTEFTQRLDAAAVYLLDAK